MILGGQSKTVLILVFAEHRYQTVGNLPVPNGGGGETTT